MARTTATEVRKIVEVETTDDLTPFIETANVMVTDHCATAVNADGSPRYDSTRLELIERWLSAHFYCILRPRPDMERADVVMERFQYRVDLGLDVTTYGQQAKRLDPAGGLAAVDEMAKNGGPTAVRGSVWAGTAIADEFEREAI